MTRQADRVAAIGRRIAHYRREAGLSAAQLAEAAGTDLTRSTIANLENGRKADLTVQQLLAIATVLDVSAQTLIGASDRLRAAMKDWERAAAGFQASMRSYVSSLLDVVAEADRAQGVLTSGERRWLDKDMRAWTPAQLTRDAVHLLLAAIERDRIPEGNYRDRLVGLLTYDQHALERASDGEHQAEA